MHPNENAINAMKWDFGISICSKCDSVGALWLFFRWTQNCQAVSLTNVWSAFYAIACKTMRRLGQSDSFQMTTCMKSNDYAHHYMQRWIGIQTGWLKNCVLELRNMQRSWVVNHHSSPSYIIIMNRMKWHQIDLSRNDCRSKRLRIPFQLHNE